MPNTTRELSACEMPRLDQLNSTSAASSTERVDIRLRFDSGFKRHISHIKCLIMITYDKQFSLALACEQGTLAYTESTFMKHDPSSREGNFKVYGAKMIKKTSQFLNGTYEPPYKVLFLMGENYEQKEKLAMYKAS